jgi:dihydroflavonol-4-reductase
MVDTTLVTGATGLLGRHLVKELLENGRSVRVLVRQASQGSVFPPEVNSVIGDIRNSDEVFEAVRGCDTVIHACSTHHYNLDPDAFFATNVIGTENICNAVQCWGCRRLVVTSTISTLGPASTAPQRNMRDLPPRQRMSVTKQLAEEIILSRVRDGLSALLVNPSYFIGPMDENPSPFRLWIPMAIRSPVRFVPAGGFNVLGAADVARFHLWALDHGAVGERYAITGENISIRDYVTQVNSAAGHCVVPRRISPRLMRMLAIGRVFDGYAADILSRQHYVSQPASSYAPLEPLPKVIAETVDWFRRSRKLTNFSAIARFVWERYV